MKFGEWCKKNRWHYTELAKELEYNNQYLSQIGRGENIPSMRLAKVIEKFTKGEVTIEELLSPDKEQIESK